jgi:ParB/RepB/Spo0J family partition protein
MPKKKYEPRRPGDDNKQHHLSAEPVRDEQAILLPLTAIKIISNIRDKDEGISELAASIAQHSLLQPLVIRKAGSTYELISGHRRYLALLELGKTEAPCRIQNVTEDEARVLQVIENLARENLSGWETCKALHGLLPLFEGNQSRIAEAIQKSRSYVSQAIAVVGAGLDVQRVEHLPLRELFQLASATRAAPKSPHEADPEVSGGPVGKPPHQSPGPPPDGHSDTKAIRFRERRGGTAFSLRVIFDAESTSPETKAEIVRQLEEILGRLRGGK